MDVPMTLGMPVIAPVVTFKVNPGGNAPAATAKTGAGTPLAVSMKLYGVPYAPTGGTLLVNCGACVAVVLVREKLAFDAE
jgi:hypothetical protein